jgi:tRNA threonylcarbamoyladenosine modification (KEOPS) complex  Pcc1 subunit
MEIDAADVTSLRAAINSYLRWIRLSYDVLKLK